ncbi:MAG: energy-coupling factor ABC transporter permease, partial [Rhodobacteraceae bacterium]|nr:energy-coupling factor ABC transporter permease [Paracoccaceae bacterium]
MHIEPGVLDASKIAYANAAAVATLGAFAPKFLSRPLDIAKTAAAAVFFSVFMQVWHTPVGPSELHFVGASAVYLTF